MNAEFSGILPSGYVFGIDNLLAVAALAHWAALANQRGKEVPPLDFGPEMVLEDIYGFAVDILRSSHEEEDGNRPKAGITVLFERDGEYVEETFDVFCTTGQYPVVPSAERPALLSIALHWEGS